MSTLRSKAMHEAVRDLPCSLNVAGVRCPSGPSVLCHVNMIGLDKGMGHKSHDVGAAGCPACHHECDNGRQLSEEKRVRTWNNAWCATFAILDATRRITLPEIDLEEFIRAHGGQVLVPADMPARIVALPGTVPDDVWLDYWRTGRAHVL